MEQRRRRAELGEHGARLGRPVPWAPTRDPSGIGALNLLADRLAGENDRLAGELLAEQMHVNRLSARLRAFEGRRAVLAEWAREAGIVVEDAVDYGRRMGRTASAELERRIAGVTRAVAVLETELMAACRDLERGPEDARSAVAVVLSMAEVERDPHASSERWRAPLRVTLEHALLDAALGEELPPSVASAFESVESDVDESRVRAYVEAATALLAKRAAHAGVVYRAWRALDHLGRAAEASENYALLTECAAIRAELTSKRDELDATELDAWVRTRLSDPCGQIKADLLNNSPMC